jgi:hypothetical protein
MADSIQDQLARLWAASMPPVVLPTATKPTETPKEPAPITAPARTFAAAALPHRCRCAVGDWQDRPADKRPGWLRTDCRRCGRFIGYRPATSTNQFDALDRID